MTENTDTKTITIELNVGCREPLPEKMTLNPYWKKTLLPILRAQSIEQLLEFDGTGEDIRAHRQ